MAKFKVGDMVTYKDFNIIIIIYRVTKDLYLYTYDGSEYPMQSMSIEQGDLYLKLKLKSLLNKL